MRFCRAGKPDVVAVTAVARELAGFIWAIARAVAAGTTEASADAMETAADSGAFISSRNAMQGEIRAWDADHRANTC